MKQLLLLTAFVLLVFGQQYAGIGRVVGGLATPVIDPSGYPPLLSGGQGTGTDNGLRGSVSGAALTNSGYSDLNTNQNQFPGGSGLDAVPADIRSRAVRVTPEVLNSLSVIAPGLRNSVPTSPGPNDQKYGGPSTQLNSFSTNAFTWRGHWVLFLHCDPWWPFCCHYFWVYLPWWEKSVIVDDIYSKISPWTLAKQHSCIDSEAIHRSKWMDVKRCLWEIHERRWAVSSL